MILDGKGVALAIQNALRDEIQALLARGKRVPQLNVILVGDHAPSKIYVERKTRACADVGIASYTHHLPGSLTEKELLTEVQRLNNDPDVDGILVQLPLPKQINSLAIISAILPSKDVDGLHPDNVGGTLLGLEEAFSPCTPLGVQVLLEKSGVSVFGKHVVILGRSNLVGKPMAALLMQNTPTANATVTLAHSKSQHLPELTRSADILIAAMGQPRFVTADMVKEGAVVVDVGINRIEDPSKKSGYALVGDVDFGTVAPKCAAITPVPGGVGPMTIAMLLSNTLKSYKMASLWM